MNEDIETDFFLPCNAFCDFFAVKVLIFLLGYFTFAEGRAVCFYILCLGEGANRSGRKLRQSQYLFLELLAFAPLG